MYLNCSRYKCQKNIVVCATTCKYSKNCKTFNNVDRTEVDSALETYSASHPEVQLTGNAKDSAQSKQYTFAHSERNKAGIEVTANTEAIVTKPPLSLDMPSTAEEKTHPRQKKKGTKKLGIKNSPKSKQSLKRRSKPKFVILHGDQYELITDKQLIETIQSYLFDKKIPLKELTVYKLGPEVEVNLQVSVKQRK